MKIFSGVSNFDQKFSSAKGRWYMKAIDLTIVVP